jgi:hypothetical protein
MVPEQPPERPPEQSAANEGLRHAIETLREQLRAERTRADTERARAETAERQMARAEKDRDMAIANHNRIADEIAGLREAHAAEVADLRAALRGELDARRAQGLLARLKAAWRGE